MKIITNNVPRDIVEGYELIEKERKEFDYINWDAVEKGEQQPQFFRYKGNLYDTDDSERVSTTLFAEWDGYYSESFFSGVLFRYVNEYEQVIVGRYYA